MKHPKHKTKIALIVNLYNQGKNYDEIVAESGFSRRLVSNKLCLARGRGYIAPRETNAYHVLKYQQQLKLSTTGSLYEALEALSGEIGHWLFKITPAGAKVSDTIAAIVRDAYYEENDVAGHR